MRVAIAEDLQIYRAGLTVLLEQAGVEVVGSCDNGVDIIDIVEREEPDVAILDIRMPRRSGLEAAADIRSKHRNTAILILTNYPETDDAVQLLENGAAGIGYRAKESMTSIALLRDTLTRITSGESVIEPSLITGLVERRSQPETTPLDQLTKREQDVLQHMAEGRANPGIANLLNLSTRTVEHNVSAIFTKFGLDAGAEYDDRRVLAVIQYLRYR